MKHRQLIPWLLSTLITPAYSEPTVIYDVGRGVSTEFYTRIFSGEEIPDFRDSWLFQDLPEAASTVPTTKRSFPITTRKLTPRRITEEQATYFAVMAYPICVIGTDDLSREWLSRNLEQLIAMNAQCLLVSAESEADTRSLLQLAQGLSVYPAHGDAIADTFKIKHYPVLITQRTISQ